MIQLDKRKKIQFIIVAAVFIVVVLEVLLFGINHWGISIQIDGEETVVIEYGGEYTDPGAEAYFCGTLFFKKGRPLEVETESNVDPEKTGEYTVTYHAEFGNYSAEKVRTVIIQDTQPPVLELNKIDGYYTLPGRTYEEEGYTATDNYDGDITDRVDSIEKDGSVYYVVRDSSGNKTEAVRAIYYDDPVPPEITLQGEKNISIKAGSDYGEPGFTASDNCDGDLTDQVAVNGKVDVYKAGTYEITYTVKDNYENETTVTRTVVVEPVRQPDNVKPDGKIIYLTFDDGPGKYTQQLLDILEEYNVKATFFVVNTGYKETELLKKEAQAGHSIGVHSATHDYSQIYASEEAFFDDFEKMQNIIKEATGKETKLLRFPGGSSNTISKKYCEGIMTTLTETVTDMGYHYFDWNVLSGDAGDTKDTEQIFKNVTEGVQKHDVSIVLQHDIHGYSVDAVEKIIIWGLGHGYTFLPLDESSPTAHQGVNN